MFSGKNVRNLQNRGGDGLAKFSILLGEYTENETTYHFGLKGKNYYITSLVSESEEQCIYESTNMHEAYAKWKSIKGNKPKKS